MSPKRWIYTDRGQPLPEPIEVEIPKNKPMPSSNGPSTQETTTTETRGPGKAVTSGNWTDYEP